MAEYLKIPERTIFWDEQLEVNMNPLGSDVGFFSAPWDTKVIVHTHGNNTRAFATRSRRVPLPPNSSRFSVSWSNGS